MGNILYIYIKTEIYIQRYRSLYQMSIDSSSYGYFQYYFISTRFFLIISHSHSFLSQQKVKI